MIIDPSDENFTINVKLKDGTLFSNHDFPSQPVGEHEKIICFWIKNKLRSYPLNEVEYYEFVPQKEKK